MRKNMTIEYKRQQTHKLRKAGELKKQAAKRKDGLGKHRVKLSQTKAGMKNAEAQLNLSRLLRKSTETNSNP